MVYVFLAEGFEEIEALTPVDILRRAGIDVQTVSINANRRTVTGARGISVNADITIGEFDKNNAELIVLPGGMPGTLNLAACGELMAVVDEFVQSKDEKKRAAAICAAPAKILGARGLLTDRKAACYPGLEGELNCRQISYENVVTDGNVTTSRGMGTALDFAVELIGLLKDKETAGTIRKSVVG